MTTSPHRYSSTTQKEDSQTGRKYYGQGHDYVNQARINAGLDRLGETGDLNVFSYPLMGAMTLPLASGLAGTGVGSAVAYGAKEAAKWVAPNVLLPYLGGRVVDEGMKMYNGKTWAENVRDGLTSMGVSDDWSDTIGEFSNPAYWTPYGKLTKPVAGMIDYAGRTADFLNSPLTGKWTQFGKRQYRFKPGHLGANGTPVESRPVLSEGLKNKGWTLSEDGVYLSPKGQRFIRNADGRLQDEASLNISKSIETIKTEKPLKQVSYVDLNNYHGEKLTGNESGFDDFALRRVPENDHFPDLSHGLDNPNDIFPIISREFEALPNGARVDLGETFSGDTSPLILQYAYRHNDRIKPVLPRNPDNMVKSNSYGIRGTEMAERFNQQLERLLDFHGYSPTAVNPAKYNEMDNTLTVPKLSFIKLHKYGGNL